jgi:minor extracellular serine protease Vpr
MDIINLSLGGDFLGWSDAPIGIAVSKVVKKGMVVVVAASENGDSGLFATGDPDSARDVITVGHVDNLRFIAFVLVPSSDPKKKIRKYTFLFFFFYNIYTK